MSEEQIIKAISKALKTWYPRDNPLHLDPIHPSAGLAGEAGKLLNLWKKDKFKPGYSWFECKNCFDTEERQCEGEYTLLVIDELGDFWYYLRILYYISGKAPQYKSIYSAFDIHELLAAMNLGAAIICYDSLDTIWLDICFSCLLTILGKFDYTLEELTESNWQKLNKRLATRNHKNPGE